MNTVSLTGYILVPEDELTNVIQAMKIHSQLTKMESGCLTFSITQDSVNPLQFHVAETFTNQVAFDYHQQRASGSNWALVSKNVSRHYKIA